MRCVAPSARPCARGWIFPNGKANSFGSIEARLNTYGRAFGDPEKGVAGQALSVLQGRKLREIRAKAEGDTKVFEAAISSS